MNKGSIEINIEAPNQLSIRDVWPDGDEPDVPTAADVMALLKDGGGVRRNLHDWSLLQDLDITVMVTVPGSTTIEKFTVQ